MESQEEAEAKSCGSSQSNQEEDHQKRAEIVPSITEIMAGAKLTPGDFYPYFKSKSDSYAEVLNCFFTDPDWKNCGEGVHVDLSATDVGAQVVRAYLSLQQFEDLENSCPILALPRDVARSGGEAGV